MCGDLGARRALAATAGASVPVAGGLGGLLCFLVGANGKLNCMSKQAQVLASLACVPATTERHPGPLLELQH